VLAQQPKPAAASQAAAAATGATAVGQRAPARQEIIVPKGLRRFRSIIPSVIDRAKASSSSRTHAQRDLHEVAAAPADRVLPRAAELINDAARLYAATSPSRTQGCLAFYRSALGKKSSPRNRPFLDKSVSGAETWAAKSADEVMGKFRAEMERRP